MHGFYKNCIKVNSFYTLHRKLLILPNMTPEAHRVLFIVAHMPLNDSKLDLFIFCKAILGTLDLQMRDEPMRGEIFVLDLKGLPLRFFLSISPFMTKKCIDLCIVSINRLRCSLHNKKKKSRIRPRQFLCK